MGASRKNAADIKMAVDAIELAFERDYISTFVICTGDSDFTPLVHKLRELNKRVIGVGVEESTSALLPPACDEFLFYDRLEGRRGPGGRAPRRGARRRVDAPRRRQPGRPTTPSRGRPQVAADSRRRSPCSSPRPSPACRAAPSGAVIASTLKRTLLRKDPTFSEADYGFRAFGELAAPPGRAQRDRARPRARPRATPRCRCPSTAATSEAAFALLVRGRAT